MTAARAGWALGWAAAACAPSDDTGLVGVTGQPAEVETSGVRVCPDASAPGFTAFAQPGDFEAQPPPLGADFGGWGLAIRDFDQDGHLDVFLPHFGANQLFMGDGQGGLWSAPELLPGDDGYTYSVAAGDLDGDGDTDLALGQDGINALLLWDDGRFVVTDTWRTWGDLTARPTHSLSVGDLDGDGDLDLWGGTTYQDLGGNAPSVPQANELWLNRGDATFEAAHDQLPLIAQNTPANAGGFIDSDRDGDADVMVVNDKPDSGFRSMILENRDGELIYDRDYQAGREMATQGMGLALGDVNRDGVEDYAVTGWGEVLLRLSSDGIWYEAAQGRGIRKDIARVVGWGLDLADLDADGDLDLLVAYGPDYDEFGDIANESDFNPVRQQWGLYEQQADGQFAERSEAWGLTVAGNRRGFVLADLDGDGFRDLVGRDLEGRARAWRGRCTAGSWAQVSLAWPGHPNAEVVGGLIEISAGDQSWSTALYPSTTSQASSSPVEAWAGLGERDTIDLITVRWPDGEETLVGPLPARQTVRIIRE